MWIRNQKGSDPRLLIRASINTPGERHLHLGEESCLIDPVMIEWLSYAMEEVLLWACSGRTTMLLPWCHCLPEALFRSCEKEASLTHMDNFRSPFLYFDLNCLVRSSISFDMSLSDLPRMEMPMLSSRAASHSNELTRLTELHDAKFSPCPLLMMNESDWRKASYPSI